MRGLGFDVLIAGVISTAEREQELEISGFPVVRLAPAASLRSLLWRSRRGDSVGSETSLSALPPRNQKRKGDNTPAGARESAASLVRTFVRRLAMTAAYYVDGLRLVLRTSPSLVHANDYNTMWIGLAAKLLRQSKLLYDSHELWPDRNGRPEWRPWLLACEALFVRTADATITTSPGYAQAIANRYGVSPPSVIRNIPSRADRPQPSSTRAADSGRTTAAYVGGLMPGRGLEPAIRALALAPDIELRLVGPGRADYRVRLQRIAEEAEVADRVMFVPAVLPDALLDAIADAALGLLLIEPICRSYELTLPNKLFEYVSAGLPILASDLPVIGPLIRDEQLGEVVPPDRVDLIAGALHRLAEPGHNHELRQRVAAFATKATWENERRVLERVYHEIAGDGEAATLPGAAAHSGD